ncbi:MAG: Flp/Fap pilin component [Chloroflexota bacterium]|jgi:Flp pilus assembly pilin Flp|nr:Flp/Fap pilin component [Chloroflexota bacterium]
MLKVLTRRDRDERGQGLAEYALILGLIAVVAIAALVFIGTSISSMLSHIGATL